MREGGSGNVRARHRELVVGEVGSRAVCERHGVGEWKINFKAA